jgi:mannose-6-phosphate isomerase-like protein (cupin superfamily)
VWSGADPATLGITAFGTNAYTAKAGQCVIQEHHERGGHQETYVVLRGRAMFTLGADEVDASAGTIVFIQPGYQEGAIRPRTGRQCSRLA